VIPLGWRTVTGVGTLGALAMLVVSGMLRPDHEILYSGSFVTAHCPEIDGRKQCVAVYRLSIANSGSARQDDVRVEWGAALEKWTLKTGVSDLVAGTVQRPDPEIIAPPGAGNSAYVIRGLEPNTVVELKLDCTLCTLEELQALKNAPLSVTGKGTVVNAEPRWTMFGRAMRNLQRIVRLVL
jgi:hypothetical protein